MRTTFEEYRFKAKVEKALETVKRILDNTRNPQLPTEVHHEYLDKYILSEFLATSSIATFLNSLEYIGITGKAWDQIKDWAKTRNVTLRLRATETCKFVKKVTRDVESDTKNVTKAGIFGKFESFTVTKVTEYLWDYSVKWELVAFVGVEIDKAIILQSHSGTTELKTTVETAPKPENLVRENLDVNITWLLHHTDDTKTPKFSIDRKSDKCHTPRRNPQVEEILSFLTSFYNWANDVTRYFRFTVFPEQQNHGLDVNSLNAEEIFVPVLPLFEDSSSSSSSSSALSPSHSSKIPPIFIPFLSEQARSLEDKRRDLARTFPQNDKLVTLTEAYVIVILQHLNRVSENYSEGVDYIEHMLFTQIVAAIGKHVTPVDFSNYLAFHNRKIFNEAYRPQLFSYAVRRPDHYPEGVLSIEAKLDDGSLSSPITTIVAQSQASHPMNFALNAATKVSFYGERFVHGYVSHQFAGQSGTELSLYARARQFSSFILLVGRIVSADLFEPKYATVIQNKDELKIPLLLETIPTPKEFKDAIASLSPEQQRFCKAFRSMQLESTLFGVCVIQIKPQLEKLLKLPEDSLTKEIQLSQDLLSLFIKYQIPSDLVSYDGPEHARVEDKTAKVKEYVSRMHEMLEGTKKQELEEAQQQQKMRFTNQSMDAIPIGGMVVHSLAEGGLEQTKRMERRASGATLGGRVALPQKPMSKMASAPAPASSARAPPAPAPSAPAPSAPAPKAVAPQSAPAPAPQAPAPQVPEPTREVKAPQKDLEPTRGEVEVVEGEIVDYTKIPTQLEQRFEEFDNNNALRPTIITPGNTWSKTFYKSLLSEAETKSMNTKDQETDRNQAFDLLDALTKSGALSVDYASLHVVIAATHCFDKSIMNTLIQDNINPIEKVENSSLIIASTIHQTAPLALIAPEHKDRISTTANAKLFGDKNLIEM